MTLRRIHVQGFKSFPDVELELGTVNVFIGANGSGKSNLFEAIGLASAAAQGSVEPQTLRYRGVRVGLPELYKTAFRGANRIRRLITIEVASAHAKYKVGLDNPISDPTPKWKFVSETLEEKSMPIMTRNPANARLFSHSGEASVLAVAKDQAAVPLAIAGRPDAQEATRLITALQSYGIFTPFTPMLRSGGPASDRVPLGLTGTGLAAAVAALRKPRAGKFGTFELDDVWELIDWADAVYAVSAAPPSSPASQAGAAARDYLFFRDKYMVPQRSLVSALDASEGALYVLFLLALVAHPDAPSVVAIDNFDQALHPQLVKRLMELVLSNVLENGRPQMLISTQNPRVLDGLDIRDERVRLFAVDRTREGYSIVNRVRVNAALLDEANAKGLSLSRLWLMGRLGATPKAFTE